MPTPRAFRRLFLVLAAAVAAVPAFAEPPKVVADIAPVHSLVVRVMDGVAVPDLLLSVNQSPHSQALRPSQAKMLQEADLVIWVGPELEPWLEKPLRALGGEAEDIWLLDVPGTHLLNYRTGALFGEHGHDEEHEADDGHDADHDDHDTEHEGEGRHEEEQVEVEHHAHGEEGTDPHAWLDPQNAAVWLTHLAERLARLDPGNAETYRANAAKGRAELAALQVRIYDMLAPMQGRPLMTTHDGFQYFEARFGLFVAGSISASDAADPGPARIAALRDAIGTGGVACVFAEPQFRMGLVEAVTGEGETPIAVLDPIGRDLQSGKGLYVRLLENMAESIAACGKG